MSNCLFEFLKKQDVKFFLDANISQFSSIGIGGRAKCLIYPETEEKLISVLKFLKSEKLNYKIAGRMTNILFKRDISDIVIIKTDKLNNYCVAENLVYSECGVNISQLFMRLADYNLGGFEELYGIPGSIGGSVFGNAGAFGRDISSLIYDLRLYDITTDEIIVKQIDDLEFSYRKSNISNRFVILSARLKLPFQPRESTLNNMKKYLQIRKDTQPYSEKSLGSVFKRNPDYPPVSYLIDSLNLKGKRVGGAVISNKHAGFVVNSGNASASDVCDLINLIKEEIFQNFNFYPEIEIEIY